MTWTYDRIVPYLLIDLMSEVAKHGSTAAKEVAEKPAVSERKRERGRGRGREKGECGRDR